MSDFFKDYHKALYCCTKPYQYVGGEFLSQNKDFASAKVRFAVAFPDKYEIGISNIGLRILYDRINSLENCMSDRVYAPEADFKPNPLYAVESKQPIKKFDAIGFSLQYELAYPSVLKLLEMGNIPYKNSERTDNDPIIIAGGPCVYNPLPMSEFIDCFMIGDGEDTVIEICDILLKLKNHSRKEKLEALSNLKGVWVADLPKNVTKRVSELKYETALKSYPISFSSAIHDRAIIEIRRGCGHMCRFCQAGHTNLPIRERSAEDVIKITKELVKNTGYDEYSLLSLSSNDYTNIKEVIKELSAEFYDKKISVSLPSQRIDGFDLELADLVQSVRKATITLAPEAGSQRLRNVIKKNLTEEQIINTCLTVYANGWSRVKLYFMTGLPTETLEDMDSIADLISKIKYRSKLMKQEKGLKHNFDITCTLSVFVPKPFTPFQWAPQMSIDKITEHIYRLKDKIKHLKGVKINYHDQSVSMIEAVLTRGDRTLCKYIEALYKKGCYLDAWGEYFNKDVWEQTAVECGICLKEEAEKTLDIKSDLPWDFISVGIEKEWLKSEYLKSFEQTATTPMQPSCEDKCVNCGVCKNLGEKQLAKPYTTNAILKLTDEKTSTPQETFKYRLKVTKYGILRYFSHLDWQNTFFKALTRTDLKMAFSQGFNPLMKVSMGIALPLFMESDGELIDIELIQRETPENIKLKLQKVLPKEAEIKEINEINKKEKSIDLTADWAEYRIKPFDTKIEQNADTDTFLDQNLYKNKNFKYNVDKVLSESEILLTKKNKKGLENTINIKSAIKSYRFEDDCLFIILKTGQRSDIKPLRADDLMKLVDNNALYDIKRLRFFDNDMREL